ncbi:MAG: hypothetical protein ACPIG6_09835, partial [Akkermansiaceae bacterium]
MSSCTPPRPIQVAAHTGGRFLRLDSPVIEAKYSESCPRIPEMISLMMDTSLVKPGKKAGRALTILSALTCMAMISSHAQEPPAQHEAGFTPLFNGKNLNGWTIHGNHAGWSVQPGGILR